MFEDGDITRDEKKRRLAAIDAQMPALELGRRAVSVLSRMVAEREGIDWDGDPAEVNAQLRNLWHHIELENWKDLRAIPGWLRGRQPPDAGSHRHHWTPQGHTDTRRVSGLISYAEPPTIAVPHVGLTRFCRSMQSGHAYTRRRLPVLRCQ